MTEIKMSLIPPTWIKLHTNPSGKCFMTGDLVDYLWGEMCVDSISDKYGELMSIVPFYLSDRCEYENLREKLKVSLKRK